MITFLFALFILTALASSNSLEIDEFTISYRWWSFNLYETMDAQKKLFVDCNVPLAMKKETQKIGYYIFLYNEDTSHEPRSEFMFGSSFQLNPNESGIVGKLTCRFNDEFDKLLRVTTNSILIPFLPCPGSHQTCQESNRCKPGGADIKYCVYTLNDTLPCTIKKDWCLLKNSSNRYCPIDEPVKPCWRLEYSEIWHQLRKSTGENCSRIYEPPLSYNGFPLLVDLPILMEPSVKYILVKCPPDSPFYNRSVSAEIHKDWNKKFEISPSPCREEAKITVGDEEFQETQVLMVILRVEEQGRIIKAKEESKMAQFVFKVVVFGTELRISNVTEIEYGRSIIKCYFTSSIATRDSDSEFLVTTWWTTKSGGPQEIDMQLPRSYQPEPSARSLKINKSDEYQCHALIEYKGCSPARIYYNRTIYSPMVYLQVQHGNVLKCGRLVLVLSIFAWSINS